MRRRLAFLRTAALLAAGFVVLRVVYRVTFGGASGGGVVIADLLRIRLPGPFEHITLFGPITTGGIGGAALSAVPFAGVILGFGLLGVVVDLRALLTRGAVRGPVRTVSRALVLAWATFPALRDSVRRVRVARELRGEHSMASLIVPILEQTVERALALGASMEVRGFAAARHVEPAATRPVVIRDADLGFPNAPHGGWILEAVDLELAPGTLTLITGATGAGKSTLLHSMSGLFQHFLEGEQRGEIEVGGADRANTPPRETAGFVGVVSQSVRLSFVAPTVAEELGFSMSVRGVAPAVVRARAADTAARLGIAHLLDRDIEALSAGEACLVAIGAAITANPVLLLVDEPLADLDTAARKRVVGVLDRLAHDDGVCVVVAEHAPDEWGTTADQRLELRDGAVRRVAHHAPTMTSVQGQNAPRAPRAGAPVVRVEHLSVSHAEVVAVDGVSLSLGSGELVALCGPNGAGKSTLLHAMARPAQAGAVSVGDVDVHTLGGRARRHLVALVPEAVEDLLFATTVDEECRRADRRAVGPRTADILAGFLGQDELGVGMRARHPRDLSAGERFCLALAIQLAGRPRVLLVDEPSRGLDAAARELVGSALVQTASSGTAVMIATHDRDFVARYATRALSMTAGRIENHNSDQISDHTSVGTVPGVTP
ncbi:MAG TPA: ATP-binding cassette domain-containing protein [Pseudolysinimonas sp.]|nr:ATP-binding cassette domain-containing protein [Pseudolysinimonas sp.]